MSMLFLLSIFIFLMVTVFALSKRLAKPPFLWVLFGLGTLLQGVLGLAGLMTGTSKVLLQFPAVPVLGTWGFQTDALADLMFLVLGLIGLAAALVATQHARHQSPGTGRGMAAIAALQYIFTGFLLTSNNAISLLIGWESMSLCAYAYILVNHRLATVRRAAYVTLFVSEVGFLMLILAIALAAPHTGNFSYVSIFQHLQTSSPGRRDEILLLALFGFGTKSGILPMQLWMPAAYDAAPPHLAAILAGGLLNLGIFGILRIVRMDPTPSLWVGVFMVGLGAAAVFSGALFGVIENKIRRLLAYSSVENVGFMVISLGLYLLFTLEHNPQMAAVAMMALLLQMVSHALAKALAFLSAGEISRKLGTTDLNRLGGLFRVMPVVTIALLITSLTLAAVAPFSGFASEWLTLQSMLQVYRSLPKAAMILIGLAGVVTATGAALGFTVFLRLFVFAMTGRIRDVSLLHQLRTSKREPFIALGLGLLAVVSSLYGWLPTAWMPLYDRVVTMFQFPATHLLASTLFQNIVPNVSINPAGNATLAGLGAGVLSVIPVRGLVIQPGGLVASIAPTYILLWFLLFMGLAWILRRMSGSTGSTQRLYPVRLVSPWLGGRYQDPHTAQYTASAYANPFRMLWATLLHYRLHRKVTQGSSAVPVRVELSRKVVPWLTVDGFVAPFRWFRLKLAGIRKIQHGYLWGYLVAMLLGLGVLLIWAVL